MRCLSLLALASLAVPAAANARDTNRTAEQAQRQEQKRSTIHCVSRDRDRPVRDGATRAECKVNLPVPPVVDPTPIFLP